MALERKLVPLEQLQGLEVGNVERVIGEIEESKHGIVSAQDETEIELEVYRRLLEEKLPQILSNITVLSDQISGLNITRNIGSLGIGNNSYNPSLDFVNEQDRFGLIIEPNISKWMYKRNGIVFVFKKDDGALERVDFYKNERKIKESVLSKNIPTLFKLGRSLKVLKEPEIIPEFRAGTTQEFSDYYVRLIMGNLRSGKDPSYYTDSVHLLSQVPGWIGEAYAHLEREQNGRLQSILSKNSSLKALDTSDF